MGYAHQGLPLRCPFGVQRAADCLGRCLSILAVRTGFIRSCSAKIEDLIQGKRLLVVPSGPLTALPFHVLVTAPPSEDLPKTFEGYRSAAWLARSNAIATLPAVSSLKALRRNAAGLAAASDYIGYGDPVLMGDSASCRSPKIPDACPAEGAQVAAASSSAGRATIRGRGGRRNAEAPRGDATLELVLEQARLRAAPCPTRPTRSGVSANASNRSPG